jgi:aryl-alcohol dehydrogenase-like predicted oxidoreductase
MVTTRVLGATGVEVSRVILGGAGFGGLGSDADLVGKGESDADAFAIMDRAWELGITTFDTADAYAGGRSEDAIGKWIASRGVRPLVATKTFHPMEPGADQGLAPARIRRQLESSLERLGIDRIDLYLTHSPDPETPLEETLATLDELVGEGLIGAYGGSHLDRSLLREAGARYGWVQNSYSLLDRADEAEVLPLVEELGVGYTPFSPLSGGWLTGKYRRDEPAPDGSRMSLRAWPYAHLDRDEVWSALDAFRSAAAARGVEPAVLALSWVLSDPRVTAILVGPRRPDQLEAPLEALELELSSDERQQLAALFP